MQQIQCSNCDRTVLLRDLKKSAAECPHCKSRLRIVSGQNDVLFKPKKPPPPKAMRLGDIIGLECPENLLTVVVRTRTLQERVRVAWDDYGKVFIKELMRQQGLHEQFKFKRDDIVPRALRAVEGLPKKPKQGAHNVQGETAVPMGWVNPKLQGR